MPPFGAAWLPVLEHEARKRARLAPGPSCSERERARNRHSRLHGLLDWLRRRTP